MNKRVAVGVCTTETPQTPSDAQNSAICFGCDCSGHTRTAFAGKSLLYVSSFWGHTDTNTPTVARKENIHTLIFFCCWCSRSHRGPIRLYLMANVGVRVTGSTLARIIFVSPHQWSTLVSKVNRIHLNTRYGRITRYFGKPPRTNFARSFQTNQMEKTSEKNCIFRCIRVYTLQARRYCFWSAVLKSSRPRDVSRIYRKFAHL